MSSGPRIKGESIPAYRARLKADNHILTKVLRGTFRHLSKVYSTVSDLDKDGHPQLDGLGKVKTKQIVETFKPYRRPTKEDMTNGKV